MAGSGLLLSDDLIFTSRITGVGSDLGLTIKVARSLDALLTLARHEQPAGVIVDLAFPGLEIASLIPELLAACGSKPRIIAYGAHVDTATLKQARQAGCDLVLPRSAFVEQLPAQLPAWLSGRASPDG
jgi:DNA-binding NarL/FixJ family response regulator